MLLNPKVRLPEEVNATYRKFEDSKLQAASDAAIDDSSSWVSMQLHSLHKLLMPRVGEVTSPIIMPHHIRRCGAPYCTGDETHLQHADGLGALSREQEGDGRLRHWRSRRGCWHGCSCQGGLAGRRQDLPPGHRAHHLTQRCFEIIICLGRLNDACTVNAPFSFY